MFISYAQNYEDVALWRALKHVDKGFYVDLGAQHPVKDSVTRAFYDHGWRGIHVEPVPTYAAMLRSDRPDEPVVEKAVGAEPGSMTLYVLEESGLSSLIEDSARAGEQMLQRKSSQITVPVITMDELLAPHAGHAIHFMKIDIEGAEKAALTGWSHDTFRPWIILIEATKPNSPEPNHHEWEPLVLAAGYEFAYFDGLNRFYVAKEHPELLDPVSRPPSVFDNFQHHAFVEQHRELQILRNAVEASRSPMVWLMRIGQRVWQRLAR